MAAHSIYLPPVENDNLVSINNGREPVSNDKAGAVLHDGIQCFGDCGFMSAVKCAGRLIQKQNLRIIEKRPRQSYSLFLPS